MKTKYWTIIFAALLLACSSGSDDNKVTPDAAGDTAVSDAAGDVTAADQGSGGDAVTQDAQNQDAAGETVDPGPTASDEYLTMLCEDLYCYQEDACDFIDYGDACVEECVAQGADVVFVKKLLCARDADDFCADFEACKGDWEVSDECVELCSLVEGCDALGTEMFGYTPLDCGLSCGAASQFSSDGEQIIACVTPALEACSGTIFMVCMDGEEFQNPCEESYCGDTLPPECALVPDPYENTAACLEVCSDWAPGQWLAAQTCIGMAMDMPFDCREGVTNCHAMPDELPEGAIDYCKAFDQKCGLQEMQEVVDMLGGMGYEICGWQVTGLTQMNPDGFNSFVDGAECAENLEVCPSGDMGGLYCLLKITDEHKAACAKVAEICPEEAAVEITLDCQAALGFASGFIPEAVDTITGCIEGAADCETLTGQCFFGDEGGEEPPPRDE